MKKNLLLFIIALCGTMAAVAQDLIVKTDASRIEARVTEITPEAVRYKRFSNPDGPTYVIPVDAVHYIRYANGETDYFTRPSEGETPQAASESIPAVPLTPARPAEPVQPAVAEPQPERVDPSDGRYVLKTYAVGDFYDVGGLQGIVCEVSEDGLHGKLLSIKEQNLAWSEFRKPDLRLAGASHRSDGAANMEAVARYIADNGLSWDDFPAFKWCRELGEGWYLPSIDELLTLGHNYNGGTRVRNDRQARNRFNETLKSHGGARIDRLVYYFSSTETNEKTAYTTHMNLEPPYVVEIPKYNRFLVRAMHLF